MKMASMISGADVGDPGAGLGDAGRDRLLADRDEHDRGRGDRADDLGEDVADGVVPDVRLSRTIAIVTAGLKCPPETWPNAKIAASRPKPNENGTTSRFGVAGRAPSWMAGDRRVADHQEQERADQLGEVLASIHPVDPSAIDAMDGLGRSHHTQCGPSAARIRSASRHVRHRTSTSSSRSTACVEARADRDRAVALEQDRVRAGARVARRGPPRCVLRAPALPGTPSARYGRRGRNRAVSGRAAGSGTSPARVSPIDAGRWAWTTAADVRAGAVDREVDGQVRGRREPGRANGPRAGIIEPDDDQVVRGRARPCAGRSASPAIRVLVEADGQVALAGGDRARARRAAVRRERWTPPAALEPASGHRTGRRAASYHLAVTSPAPAARPAAATPPDVDIPLGQNRDFKVLLGSQGISALGDAVSFTALPLLVLALTGSGLRDGHRRRAPDAAGPVPRDARRRPRRPQRSQADDVPGRLRTGDADRADPDLGVPRRTDDGRHPDRGRADEHPSLVLPGGLHRLGAGPRRAGRRSAGPTRSSRRIYSVGFIVGPAIAGLLAATIGPGPTLAIDAHLVRPVRPGARCSSSATCGRRSIGRASGC